MEPGGLEIFHFIVRGSLVADGSQDFGLVEDLSRAAEFDELIRKKMAERVWLRPESRSLERTFQLEDQRLSISG